MMPRLIPIICAIVSVSSVVFWLAAGFAFAISGYRLPVYDWKMLFLLTFMVNVVTGPIAVVYVLEAKDRDDEEKP